MRRSRKLKFQKARIGLAVEGPLGHSTQMELAGKSSRECGIRTRRVDATRKNEEVTSQQLKQEKLEISKLYQENRELKRQLATKTRKQ
jgi:hypothetical protein